MTSSDNGFNTKSAAPSSRHLIMNAGESRLEHTNFVLVIEFYDFSYLPIGTTLFIEPSIKS